MRLTIAALALILGVHLVFTSHVASAMDVEFWENQHFTGRSQRVTAPHCEADNPTTWGFAAASVKIYSRGWITFGSGSLGNGRAKYRLNVHGPIEIPNLGDIKRPTEPFGTDDWFNDIDCVGSSATAPGKIKRNEMHSPSDGMFFPTAHVYEHDNHQGGHQELSIGDYRADHGDLDDVGDNSVSSLRVPGGLRVHMWDSAGPVGSLQGTGIYKAFGPGQHGNVPSDFNDKASFIWVEFIGEAAP